MSKLNIKINGDRVNITMGNPIYIVPINEYFDESLVDNQTEGGFLRENEAIEYLLENGFELYDQSHFYIKKDDNSLVNFIARVVKLHIKGKNDFEIPFIK